MAEPAAAATMCEAFQATAARCPQQVALRSVDGAASITWAQSASRVRLIAAGLARLGVGRGDTVALMMTNRPEFHLVDTAAFHLGAAPFSVYNTLAPGQIGYVLADAGSRVVVCEQQFAPRLLEVTAGTPAGRAQCPVLILPPTPLAHEARRPVTGVLAPDPYHRPDLAP